jgi:hypothetical protein
MFGADTVVMQGLGLSAGEMDIEGMRDRAAAASAGSLAYESRLGGLKGEGLS